MRICVLKKAVIIGGGAAGMFASIQLAKRGFDVTVLEKNEKLGKKIFITGKGRCNFTNDCEQQIFFSSVMRNPKFLYSAYHAFSAQDAMAFFENAGMPVKVERGQRAFPVSDHAYDVTDALKRLMKRYGVKILLHAEAEEIDFDPEAGVRGIYYHLTENIKDVSSREKNGKCRASQSVKYTEGERLYLEADRILVATGGLSYPSTGSTGDGYRFAEKTGHTVQPQKPSLVPLLTEENVSALAGLSLKNVTLTLHDGKKAISEGFGEMLFTHKGISGPLVLTASSVLAGREKVYPVRAEIDLKPNVSAEEFDKRILRTLETHGDKNLSNLLREFYPASMIEFMLDLCEMDGSQKARTMTKAQRTRLVAVTKHFPLTITGTAGFSEAVITKGGISVRDIDPKTMMSKKVNGLYFAGEVIDVDALTGGFNLQIAWSTAYAAGNAPEREPYES